MSSSAASASSSSGAASRCAQTGPPGTTTPHSASPQHSAGSKATPQCERPLVDSAGVTRLVRPTTGARACIGTGGLRRWGRPAAQATARCAWMSECRSPRAAGVNGSPLAARASCNEIVVELSRRSTRSMTLPAPSTVTRSHGVLATKIGSSGGPLHNSADSGVTASNSVLPYRVTRRMRASRLPIVIAFHCSVSGSSRVFQSRARASTRTMRSTSKREVIDRDSARVSTRTHQNASGSATTGATTVQATTAQNGSGALIMDSPRISTAPSPT